MLLSYLGPERLAVLERWLPNSVIILDRFRCISGIHNIPMVKVLVNHVTIAAKMT